MLAEAVGTILLKEKDYMHEIIEQMFAGGLSKILTDSLSDLIKYIPELKYEIQERLLDLLSLILTQKPFNYPGNIFMIFNKKK